MFYKDLGMLIKLVKCIKALKIGVPKVFGGLWETAFIMPPFSAITD